MKDRPIHICPGCGLQVKTTAEEYFCPKYGFHIVEPLGKRCEYCLEKLRAVKKDKSA
jgi:predicted amidophosphoribosyltransferase